MSSIDERIVEMKFNNSQFEKGVKDSNKSLDDLKKGLNLDGAKKSLADLASAGKSFTLQGIADGVQTIASKFSALSVIGITALANITNSAINAGAALVKSLTIAPIMDGFREYELKMGSIQTILSNTSKAGTTLDQVTASLDELNTYADKTIYNFGDMTKNIGLFTNAGIGIESATSMIKGFSNEAAASGTNSQGAASAAYQLSQALSAGKITLMDWRSLQNVGMGNANMKSGILEIAQAMGTLEGKGITATEINKDFNGSLEKGWLTADVMSSYLQIMAGDMDAAAQKAMGLSDAQVAAFSKQQLIAEEAATKVRTWTQLVGTLQEGVGSSWSTTFDLIIGDFDSATALWTKVNDTLGPMIAASGDARNALLKSFVDLGGREVAIEIITNAFNALMSILKPIGDAWKEVFPAATGEQLFKIAESVRDFTKSLVLSGKDSENVKTIFKGLFSALSVGWEIIKGGVGLVFRLLGALGQLVGPLVALVAGFIAPTVAGDGLVKTGDKVANFFETLGDFILKPIEMLQKFVDWLVKGAEKLRELDLFGFAADADKAGKDLGILEVIGNAITRVWGGVKDMFGKVGDFLKTVGGEIKNFFDDVGPGIEDGINNIDWNLVLNLVQAGLFGGLLIAVKKFVGGFADSFTSLGGGGIVDTIKGVFGGLTDTMKTMQDSLKAKTLLTIAGAIAVLTVSVIALSLIDSEALARALGAMAFMFTNLGVALNVFTKVVATPGIAKLPIVAAALILLSTAIVVLSAAVTILSKLDWNELAKGLTGVTVLLGVLVLAAKGLSTIGPGLTTTGIGLILLATAIKILASSVTDLAGLSWEELAKGLGGVTVLLAALYGFTKVIKNPAGIVGTAAAIAILGVAMKILANAMQDFSGMDWEQLSKGMVGMAGALSGVAIGMRLMPKGPGMIASAAALVIVSAALLILSDALLKMSGLSWDDIGRVSVVLAGSLAVIALAMAGMSGAIAGAAALIVVAAALVILADAFKEMAKLDWDDIGRLAVILAGSLLIIAGAMYLMTGAILGAAALLVVAAALTVLVPPLMLLGEMSWDEIGRGLTVLAGALVILAAGGLLLTVALPAFLGLGTAILLIGAGTLAAGIGLTLLSAGLIALALAGTAGAGAITLFGMAIINLIPMAMEALANGIIAMAGVIANAGPQMTAAITTFLMSILNSINTLAPQIVNTLWNLVMLMVDTLVTNVPKLVDAGLKLLTGILDGIGRNIGKIVDSATNIITKFLDGIARNLPKVIQSAINLIISFVNGLADGIRNNQAKMEAAGKNLAGAIVDGIVGGLGNGINMVINAAKKLANGALSAVKNFLGIASPSKEFFKVGSWSAEGMANGLIKMGAKVASAAVGVGKTALSTMKSAIAKVSEVVSSDINVQPTIRPVLDLSALKAGASEIPGMFGKPSLNVDAAYANASSIEAARRARTPTAAEVEADNEAFAQIVYNQYNSSPKALSSAEIYRQTKNGLSVVKGELVK